MDKQLLSQLRDIRGVGEISIWPPAIIWLILAIALLVICAGIYNYRCYRAKRNAIWHEDVKSRFSKLRVENNGKKQAAALSELLRILAMHRCGRDVCAGLEGEMWLKWLSENDPKGFDWSINAKVLIEAPYAPPNFVSAEEIEPLIKAAERWKK